MRVWRVRGQSMSPTYRSGDIVLVARRSAKVGSVVVARLAGRMVLKRVQSIQDDTYFLVGDNAAESVDSREYGPVRERAIVGVVKAHMKTVVAVEPPKVLDARAIPVAWVIASITAGMIVLQLFRIDKVVPELARWGIGANPKLDLALFVTLVAAELFSLPFLLRMKLSPLAHVVGAILVILVPWAWLLLNLWLVGTNTSTFELGHHLSTPSGLVAIGAHAVWVLVAAWVVRAYGVRQYLGLLRHYRTSRS